MKELLGKIQNKTARIAVIGLGYVGLPLAVEKGKVGYQVTGIEQNPDRKDKINRGENYIKDVKDEELALLVQKGLLKATDRFEVIAESDVVIMCVPTPLTKNKEPDISYIVAVTDQIAKYMHKGLLVILESTSYPGTTEEVILPKLQKSGLKVGADFFLAFSPERVDPGNKRYSTRNTFKIVGGLTPGCLEIAKTFYDQTIINVIAVSSPRVAEMTKVFENIFRSVNIALVNELAILCDRMAIDVYEVIEAASTKNFGFMPFYPGPGVGGHCIPLDPYYLSWKSKEYDLHSRFIELAGEINETMPYFVVQKIGAVLNYLGKCKKDSRILVLGVAYKKDIDDYRESPALKVIELLERDGVLLQYHDPFVEAFHHAGKTYVRKDLTADLLRATDLVVILTDHSAYDYAFLAENSPVIVDTRNATRGLIGKNIYRLSTPVI